jgi:hypothetical protein
VYLKCKRCVQLLLVLTVLGGIVWWFWVEYGDGDWPWGDADEQDADEDEDRLKDSGSWYA